MEFDATHVTSHASKCIFTLLGRAEEYEEGEREESQLLALFN